MADEIDRANDTAQQMLDLQLAHREDVPRPIGVCHYCAEPVPGDLRFCDIGCRDDWEFEQRQRRANGR